MPQFPRSQRTVNASQTPLPYSSGGGYAAPGAALQKLGSQISSFAGKLQAEQEKADEFAFKTGLQKFANEQEQKYTSYRDTIDGDAGNFPTDVLRGFDKDWSKFQEGIPPQLRQKAELYKERFRGDYQRRSYGDQQRIRSRWYVSQGTDLFAKTILPRVTGDIRSVESGLTATENIIGSMSGVPPQVANKLREQAAQQIFKKWLQAAGPDAAPAAREIIERYKATRIGATPGSARAAQETGVEQTPPPNKVPKGKPLTFFETRVPTPSERRDIFRLGGVVVNLDTNWSRGGQTSPMVVIPDGATPQQRAAAEKYAAAIAEVYKRQFGTSLAPKIVTRSQNGRGRAATMHTEPFAVTDKKAVAYFMSEAGRAEHARILRETLGTIPGVRFSIPHNPSKGDRGAAGNGIDEVKHAQALIATLKGSNGVAPTTVAEYKRGPLSARDHFERLVIENAEKIERGAERIVKQRAKEAAVAEAAKRAERILLGNERFNKYNPAERKLIDTFFERDAFRAAAEQGDPRAMKAILEAAGRLNYLPKAASQSIMFLITHQEEDKRALGYQVAGQILAQRPNAFHEVDEGGRIAKESETFLGLVRNRGLTTQEALARMRELDSPEWQAKSSQRSADGKKQAAALTASDLEAAFNGPAWGDQPELQGAGRDAIAMNAFRELYREKFIETGDDKLAKDLAVKQMKRMYGVSTMTGKPTLMRYPPERFFEPVGNPRRTKDWFSAVARDHEWLAKDAQRSIRAQTGMKVEPGKIVVAADYETQQAIGRRQKPSYVLFYQDANGVWQKATQRWTPDQEAAQKRFREIFAEKRQQRLKREKARPILRPGSILDRVFGGE